MKTDNHDTKAAERAEQLPLFGTEMVEKEKTIPPQQVTGLKKAYGYYRDVAMRLLKCAEKDNLEFEDGKNKPYIRQRNINDAFRRIRREPSECLDIMERLGLLEEKKTAPVGWYIKPDAVVGDVMPPLKTKKLRSYANQLYRLKGYRELRDTNEVVQRVHTKNTILGWLIKKGEPNPTEVLDQLVAKNYLIKNVKDEKADSYIVCQTQKQGRNL